MIMFLSQPTIGILKELLAEAIAFSVAGTIDSNV